MRHPYLIIPRIVRKDCTDASGNPVSAGSRQAVLIQCIFRSNFVIFGYQVVANVYGAERAAVASVMAAIVVPLYNVLAVVTLEYFQKSKKGLRPVLIGIAKNPLIIGAAAALLFKLSGITIPTPVHTGLSDLAGIATPLALVVLGGTFHFNALRHNAGAILIGTVRQDYPGAAHHGAGGGGARLPGRKPPLAGDRLRFAGGGQLLYDGGRLRGHDPELAGQLVVVTSVLSMASVLGWIFLLRTLGCI